MQQIGFLLLLESLTAQGLCPHLNRKANATALASWIPVPCFYPAIFISRPCRVTIASRSLPSILFACTRAWFAQGPVGSSFV